eukprot:Clim_evm107s157 gene=Clim_evmTU107s157
MGQRQSQDENDRREREPLSASSSEGESSYDVRGTRADIANGGLARPNGLKASSDGGSDDYGTARGSGRSSRHRRQWSSQWNPHMDQQSNSYTDAEEEVPILYPQSYEVGGSRQSTAQAYSEIFTGWTRFYANYVLVILLLIYINNQVSRSIIYYTEDELRAGLDLTSSQYGLLSGYAFSLVFVIAGIPLGRMVDLSSRKYLLIFGAVLWSCATALTSMSRNFAEIFALRVLLGLGQSVCNPAAFGLISDYFPLRHHAFANSVYNFGIYLGGGIASYGGSYGSELYGWRTTFAILGLSGLAVAVIAFITVRDPPRGRYNPTGSQGNRHRSDRYSFPFTIKYVMSLDIAMLFTLAAGIRMISGYVYGAYVFGYLKSVWNPDETVGQPTNLPMALDPREPVTGVPPSFDVFPALFGASTLVGGVISSFFGGYITRRWGASQEKAPILVPAIGAITSIPFVIVMLFADKFLGGINEVSFTVMIGCVFMSYLTAEVWGGPAASVLQATVPAQMTGTVFAMYFFFTTLLGGSGPEIVGLLKGAHDPLILAIVICGGYFISALLFIISSGWLHRDLKRRELFDSTAFLTSINSGKVVGYVVFFSVCLLSAGALIAVSLMSN